MDLFYFLSLSSLDLYPSESPPFETDETLFPLVGFFNYIPAPTPVTILRVVDWDIFYVLFNLLFFYSTSLGLAFSFPPVFYFLSV